MKPSRSAEKQSPEMILLRGLKEDALTEKIIIPLFEAKGHECWAEDEIPRFIHRQVDKTHGTKESDHKCDVLLVKHEFGSTYFEGIQVKAREDIASDTYVNKINTDAGLALQCPYKGSDGKTHRLGMYHWITSGKLTPNGRRAVCSLLENRWSLTLGRIDIWDCIRLLDEIRRWKPDLLPPLKLLTLKEKITERKGTAFASWYSYEAFRWYLKHSPTDLSAAKRHLEEARTALSSDPRSPLFFRRTLSRFYQMWIDLVDAAPQTLASGKFDPIADIEKQEVRSVLQAKYPGTMYWLLSDVSFALEQLALLEDRYVNAVPGLSTLQICQLLLRTAHPPESAGIAARLDRLLKEEFGESNGESIDQECSLCTGTAISCLALANTRSTKTAAPRPLRWLKSLKKDRYVYHPDFYVGAPATEHGMHYASTVLEGFLAAEYPKFSALRDVFRVFFRDISGAAVSLDTWMRYRNIDRFEIYSFILPAILRCRLAGLPLEIPDSDILQAAIDDLVHAIRLEGEATSNPPWRSYVGRENLGSLSLDFLLRPHGDHDLARRIAGVFHVRVTHRAKEKPGTVRLWDSNVDRSAGFIDAYLLYWETLLAVESSSGRDVMERLLPQNLSSGSSRDSGIGTAGQQ